VARRIAGVGNEQINIWHERTSAGRGEVLPSDHAATTCGGAVLPKDEFSHMVNAGV